MHTHSLRIFNWSKNRHKFGKILNRIYFYLSKQLCLSNRCIRFTPCYVSVWFGRGVLNFIYQLPMQDHSLVDKNTVGHSLPALLQLHFHSRLNTMLQRIGQRHLQVETKILKYGGLVHLILEVWRHTLYAIITVTELIMCSFQYRWSNPEVYG